MGVQLFFYYESKFMQKNKDKLLIPFLGYIKMSGLKKLQLIGRPVSLELINRLFLRNSMLISTRFSRI